MIKQPEERFRAVNTFMSARRGQSVTDCRVAVFGIPFDCGTSAERIGARHGPDAIRIQSKMLGPYHDKHPTTHLIEAHKLVDLGNVAVTPSIIASSFNLIAEASYFVCSAGAVPLTFGGDGAVTLPQLRGLARCYPNLVVLHIDSHTDTYPNKPSYPSPYTTATTFYHAAKEGIVAANHSVHLGFHGDSSIPDAVQPALDLGYHVFTLDQMLEVGIAAMLQRVKKILADRPTYICFDMDIFDPSCAPGVCAPTWGGLTAREGIHLIRQLKGLNIVAVDINTVSPPHDPSGMTALLAATVAYEFLAILL